MLAQFVTPALFLAGAGAVAAPILIHLLARRRFKRIRWAAIDFLLQAERRNKRRLRMEEWILLVLRCLSVFLIGVFIARPFLAPGATLAGLTGSRRVERVLLLDDSFSMGYQSTTGETRFDRAKMGIRRLVDVIRQEGTDTDTVTLVRMSAPASPVEAGVYLDDRQTGQLLERLDGLNVSQRSIEPGAVMEGVSDLLKRTNDLSGVVLYVLSDFQRHQWIKSESGGSEGGAVLFDALTAWAGKDRGLRLVFVNVAEPEASNVAVTSLRVEHGQLVAGSTGRLRAEIGNFGNHPAGGLNLRVSVDNVPQPPVVIQEIAPRQTTSIDLELEFPRPGPQVVRVELPGDALPIDNGRFLAADVLGAIRVLVVNGEPSADRYGDEVTFLLTALKPEGPLFSGNEPVVVDEAEFDSVNLSNFHVVILANVYRLSDPGVESLERFVRNGGGVLAFLGDQVDPDLYNGELFREGFGLLPCRLGEIIRPATEAHLNLKDRLHPALRGMGVESDPLGIGLIPFFQFFSCEPWQGIAEGAEGARQAPPGGEKPATVPAAFDDAEGHPAVVERVYGAGRVILFTTTVDKEWNLWPDHPTYLPVLIEFTQHVARRGELERERRVGETIEIAIDPATFESESVVRTPGYPAVAEVSLSATTPPGSDEMKLIWSQTDSAGVYRFILRRRDGAEAVRVVAVNLDPDECDLATAVENDLRRAFPGIAFEYFTGIDQLSSAGSEGRTELWRTFLFAAAIFLVTEQSLAWFWGRRR
jgi:hypothetical protein